MGEGLWGTTKLTYMLCLYIGVMWYVELFALLEGNVLFK